MLKSLYAVCAILLLISCGSPERKNTPVNPEPKIAVSDSVSELMKAYKQTIESLDATKEQSVTEAAENYAKRFSGSGEQLCDSAFVLFHQFYREVEVKLNERLEKEEALSEFPCVTYDSLGKEQPFDKRFLSFKKSLEKHGFRIECPEGIVGIAQDRIFLKTHFYRFLSPVMKTFLEAVRKEREEQFAYDAGIVISSREYVDRLVWWDEFNRKHPDFILSGIGKTNQVVLFTYFLTGMDNTPLIEFSTDENGVEQEGGLDPYFADAYAYLSKKYPDSPLNALVKPYKMAVLKHDSAKRERLIKTYTKRGLMIDFTKDFQWDLLY